MLDISDRYSQDEDIIRVQSTCDSIIQYFKNFHGSLRMAEQELGISKSTIHRYIYTYIRHDYNEDYTELKSLMQYNKRYRCKPRKYWSAY